jgi:predicted  nucleic acid-binding Zn-ribbon protein
MMDDEYEILPHKLLEDLKFDVEALKKKLSEPETTSQELIAEIEDFKGTLRDLQNVFKEALQDLKEDDSAKLLHALQNKVETITTQNETIARGMVAISDKLDDFMKHSSHQPTIIPHSFHPKMPSPPKPPSLGAPPKRKSIFR